MTVVADTLLLDPARLSVDDGYVPGVPEPLRRRIVEPFHTTKPQDQGTGVGLSVSQGLAEAHGGRLELAPAPVGAAAARFLDQARRPMLKKPFTPEAVRRFLDRMDAR